MLQTSLAFKSNKRFATSGLNAPTPDFISRGGAIPASVGGWDQVSALDQMPPNRAVTIDNWVCRPGYIEIRRGQQEWATGINSATTPVETIMVYNAPAGNKMFAWGGGSLYETTAGGAVGAPIFSGRTSSRWQYTNFGNSAGTFLFCVNGVDQELYYDGTTWANFTWTGSPAASSVRQINAWKGFIWLVPNTSQTVYYLAQNAITGPSTAFELGPLMTKGGYVLAIGTWTNDTKQTVDDYIAFITTRGQVLVYQGTSPTSANTFALVGVYDIGTPIGTRCYLKIAGNLFIITLQGVIPMNEMLAQDRSTAPAVAITSTIMNAMNASAQSYASNWGWQFQSYPKGTLAILNIPTTENDTSLQYVMNTLTGAWSRFTGINVNCWETMNDIMYVGTNVGTVNVWDVDSADVDTPIVATVNTAFNYLKDRAHLKKFNMIQPIITTDGTLTPGVGINTDFGGGGTVSTPSSVSTGAALWDVAIWDTALWPTNSATTSDWQSIAGYGHCVSVITQVTSSASGSTSGVLLQLNSWNLTYETAKGYV